MKPGMTGLLDVQFASIEAAKVSWFVNGKPLTPDVTRVKAMSAQSFAKVNIMKAEPEDAGEYRVLIENKSGQVEHKVTVLVPQPQEEVKKPEERKPEERKPEEKKPEEEKQEKEKPEEKKPEEKKPEEKKPEEKKPEEKKPEEKKPEEKKPDEKKPEEKKPEEEKKAEEKKPEEKKPEEKKPEEEKKAEESGFMKGLENVVLEEASGTVVFTCEVAKEKMKADWFKNGKPLKASNRIKFVSAGKQHSLEVLGKKVPDDEAEYSVFFRQGNLKSAAKLIIKGASPSIRFHANSMLIIMLLLSSLAQVVAT